MVPPDRPSPDAPTETMVRRCRHCGAEIPGTMAFCSKCGASAIVAPGPADPLRDQVQLLFGTELEIERELGRGGMAAVYAAFDTALQRRVAVKVLLPEIAHDHSMADRFVREARTVAALQHPNVVTVYGVRGGNGVHAIVMQFVEGRSLDAVLAERGRLPVHVAGLLLAQASEGLLHAHERGVVHRDVKPANVLIDRDGHAVVSDFGIARRDHAPRITDTGLVVGTWAYMSPEQRSAQDVTPATDQYALGIMAFELLTGQLPFNGPPAEMLRAHMMDAPPSLRALNPGVPASVDAIVQRMLAKTPEERLPSLRDAERAFRKMVPDEGQTTLQMSAYATVGMTGKASAVMAAVTRPVPSRSAPTAPVAAADPSATPTVAMPAPPKRSRTPAFLVAAVIIIGAVGVAVASRSKSGAPTNTPAATMTPAQMANGGSPAPATEPASAPAPAGTTPSQVPQQRSAPAPGGDNAATVAPSGPVKAAPLATPGTPTGGDATPKSEPKSETPPSAPLAAPARNMPASSVADARRLGREFVTLLNQRRYREIAQLQSLGGDAATRAELIKLTESATDFAVGFDRVPSAPEEWSGGFQTEFFLDLEWRGGKKAIRVRLFAAPGDAGWHTVGFAADVP